MFLVFDYKSWAVVAGGDHNVQWTRTTQILIKYKISCATQSLEPVKIH